MNKQSRQKYTIVLLQIWLNSNIRSDYLGSTASTEEIAPNQSGQLPARRENNDHGQQVHSYHCRAPPAGIEDRPPLAGR